MYDWNRRHLLLLAVVLISTGSVSSHGAKLIYTPGNSLNVSISSVGIDVRKTTLYPFELRACDASEVGIQIRTENQTYEIALADKVTLHNPDGTIKTTLSTDFLSCAEYAYVKFLMKFENGVLEFSHVYNGTSDKLINWNLNTLNIIDITLTTTGASGLWNFKVDEICSKYVDVVIALDSSTSMSEENFGITKIFARNVLCGLDLKSGKARFASLAYGTVVEEITYINNKNEEVINAKLDGYKKHDSTNTVVLTKTPDAIFRMIQILKNNERPGVPQVGIVVTDGRSTDHVGDAANYASETGITMLAVGTGNIYLKDELLMIAAYNPNHTFEAENYFDNLNEALAKTLKTVCKIAVETPVTTTSTKTTTSTTTTTTTTPTTTAEPIVYKYVTGPTELVLAFDYCPVEAGSQNDQFNSFKKFLKNLSNYLKLGEMDVNLKAGSYCSDFRSITSVDDFTGNRIGNMFSAFAIDRLILVLFVMSHENDKNLNALIDVLKWRYEEKLVVLAVGFKDLVDNIHMVEFELKLAQLSDNTYIMQSSAEIFSKGYSTLMDLISQNAATTSGETIVRTWIDSNFKWLSYYSYRNILNFTQELEAGLMNLQSFGIRSSDFVQHEALSQLISKQIDNTAHNVDNANTHLAIAHIREELSAIPDLGNSIGRKVGIIITDGPAKTFLTMLEEKKAADEGIEIYFVGIGNNVTMENLLFKLDLQDLSTVVAEASGLINQLGTGIGAMSVGIDSSNSVSDKILGSLSVFMMSFPAQLLLLNNGNGMRYGFFIYNDWVHQLWPVQPISFTNLPQLQLNHLKNYPATHHAINSLVHMLSSTSSPDRKKYGVIITDHVSSPSTGSRYLLEQAVKHAAVNGITLIPIGIHVDRQELLTIANMDDSLVIDVDSLDSDVFTSFWSKLDTTSPVDVVVAMVSSKNLTLDTEIKEFVNQFINKTSDQNIHHYGINLFGHDFSMDITGYAKHSLITNALPFNRNIVTMAKPPVKGFPLISQAMSNINEILYEKQNSPVVPKVGVLVTSAGSTIQNIQALWGNARASSRLNNNLLAMGIGNSVAINLLQSTVTGNENTYRSSNMQEFETEGLAWLLQRLNTLASHKGGMCDKYVDVGIAIDSSESFTTETFAALKDFAKTIAEGLAIETGKADYAAVTFGNIVEHVTIFEDSLPSIISKLDNHPQQSSDTSYIYTFTHLGLQNMTELLLGHRHNVPKVAIVLSDGKSSNVNKLKAAADNAFANGIHLLAVGVDNDKISYQKELQYVGQGNPLNIFEATNFEDELASAAVAVLNRICDLAVRDEITTTTSTTTTSTTTTTPATTTTTPTTTTPTTTTTTPSTTTTMPTTISAESTTISKVNLWCEKEECKISEFESFVPVENDCRKYWHCTRPNKTADWTYYEKECPYTTFWNPVKNVCDHPHNTICPSDKCRNKPNGYRHEVMQKCNAYYECLDDRSTFLNCPRQNLFNTITKKCYPSKLTPECHGPSLRPETCTRLAVSNDMTKYYDRQIGLALPCARGTLFYTDICDCDHPRDGSLPSAGLGGDDDGECKDMSQEPNEYLQNLAKSTKYTIDSNKYDISRLANMDFQNSMAMEFKINPSTIPQQGLTPFIENCNSSTEQTIQIQMNATFMKAKIKINDQHLILSKTLSSSAKGRWIDVKYAYDGEYFKFDVDNTTQPEQAFLNGTIPQCKSSLKIGNVRDPSSGPYIEGYMKEFKVYNCIPTNFF